MAHPFTAMPTLVELIAKLKKLGCIDRELSAEMVGPEGPMRVRYVLNPQTKGFVIIPNIADDEHVVPTLIGHIERRLGVSTGFSSMPPPDDE